MTHHSLRKLDGPDKKAVCVRSFIAKAAPPTWGEAAAMQDVSAALPQALSELVREPAL